MKKKLNILFVCKYNRFRSRVAEAYFKKINKNKNLKIDSAGAIKGNPINKNTVAAAKEFGLGIKGNPKSLSSRLLKKQDLVVIVADNVPKSLISKKYVNNIIKWDIKDAKETSKAGQERIIKQVVKRVDKLNKDLEKGKLN